VKSKLLISFFCTLYFSAALFNSAANAFPRGVDDGRICKAMSKARRSDFSNGMHTLFIKVLSDKSGSSTGNTVRIFKIMIAGAGNQ
jgi:hypothetical protein